MNIQGALTLEQAEAMMERSGGSLDLTGCTGLTALPDGLTVGGSLDLTDCTGLTALPDGLTVGGKLDLTGCTGLTALPDGLTVGGSLYLTGCQMNRWQELRKVKCLADGDYVPGRYIFADDILTHCKAKRRVNGYDLFIGKIKGQNVVSDGEFYAHCKTLREGIADIAFKRAADRGADQFKSLTLDSELPLDQMIAAYRIITGACKAGSEHFVQSLREVKDSYTIREAIEITKGQYNAERFAEFFEEEEAN